MIRAADYVPAPTLQDGWLVQRVGDLVDLVNGHPFSSEDFAAEGDIPLVRIRDLTADEFDIYVPRGVVPRRAVLEAGDVVVGMDGDFNVVVWDRGPAALNQRLCMLRPLAGTDHMFVAYALPALLKVVNDLTFSTTVKHLSSSDILGQRLPAPSIDEQRRIADFLDAETSHLDQLMALRDRQVTLLSERTSLRWQGILDDQAGSDLVPLRRHLVSIADGPFGSSLKSSHYTDGGARVIRLGNVGTGEFLDGDEAFVSMDYFEELQAYAARAGDVVIAGLGDSSRPVGRACVVPDIGAAIVKADCYRLRFDKAGLLHDYAALAISAPRVTSRTATLSRGSTRTRINTDVAREIAIPVPALSIQRSVVAAIAETRQESARLQSALTGQVSLLRERRQALITAAVTGQFDVTTATVRMP